MAPKRRSCIQLPSDSKLLLQYIDGAESNNSYSDFNGYIGAEEALTDHLERYLIDDELTRQASETSVRQSNFSATPSPTGSNSTPTN